MARVVFMLLLFFGGIRSGWTQEDPVLINGLVKNDSLVLKDINIINKTSKLGTASDVYGFFKMPVQKGDSIAFSSLVYKNRIIIITDTHINNKRMIVYLEPDINALEEIQLQQSFRFPILSENLDPYQIQDVTGPPKPDARQLTDPTAKLRYGIDFMGILRKLTRKIRLKKKAEKQNRAQIAALKRQFTTTIRVNYGDQLFVEWLKIPQEEIEFFLDFCTSRGLVELFDQEDIFIKDFLLKASREYKQIRAE